MSLPKRFRFILMQLVLLLAVLCSGGAVWAQGGTGGTGGAGDLGAGNLTQANKYDPNPGTAFDIRKNYFLRYPVAREFGPTVVGGHDVIQKGYSIGPGVIVHCKSGPVQVWPTNIPCAVSTVPTKRDEGIMDDLFQTFGYPVSDTQFQIIQRYNDNRMLEQLYDPEKLMWLSNCIGNLQATSAANSSAGLARNQANTAIDNCNPDKKGYLQNFTADGKNVWNKIRDQLFVPMAILLMLPGAVMSQVKAIIAQGTTVLGDINPWEGILRSIVCIFLIPATYLVVNYGIDVNNSIAKTIKDEYARIFQSDMYEDAKCSQKRAFPIRKPEDNDNGLFKKNKNPTPPISTPWAENEALNFDVRSEICNEKGKGGENKGTDEGEVHDKAIARLAINGANFSMTGAFNVLTAFQTAYMLYLFCMGPIAAALWVWPMKQLRDAFGGWVAGVVTLSFWSLFWNTTILLMACFKGVDDTGTIIMSALNWLACASVHYAFNFQDLVSAAGQQAGGAAAEKMAAASKGGVPGGSRGAGQGAGGEPGPGPGGPGPGPGTGAMPGVPGTAGAGAGQSHALSATGMTGGAGLGDILASHGGMGGGPGPGAPRMGIGPVPGSDEGPPTGGGPGGAFGGGGAMDSGVHVPPPGTGGAVLGDTGPGHVPGQHGQGQHQGTMGSAMDQAFHAATGQHMPGMGGPGPGGFDFAQPGGPGASQIPGSSEIQGFTGAVSDVMGQGGPTPQNLQNAAENLLGREMRDPNSLLNQAGIPNIPGSEPGGMMPGSPGSGIPGVNLEGGPGGLPPGALPGGGLPPMTDPMTGQPLGPGGIPGMSGTGVPGIDGSNIPGVAMPGMPGVDGLGIPSNVTAGFSLDGTSVPGMPPPGGFIPGALDPSSMVPIQPTFSGMQMDPNAGAVMQPAFDQAHNMAYMVNSATGAAYYQAADGNFFHYNTNSGMAYGEMQPQSGQVVAYNPQEGQYYAAQSVPAQVQYENTSQYNPAQGGAGGATFDSATLNYQSGGGTVQQQYDQTPQPQPQPQQQGGGTVNYEQAPQQYSAHHVEPSSSTGGYIAMPQYSESAPAPAPAPAPPPPPPPPEPPAPQQYYSTQAPQQYSDPSPPPPQSAPPPPPPQYNEPPPQQQVYYSAPSSQSSSHYKPSAPPSESSSTPSESQDSAENAGGQSAIGKALGPAGTQKGGSKSANWMDGFRGNTSQSKKEEEEEKKKDPGLPPSSSE